MKIKDKVSGEVYEAETWTNWNGVVQYVKKGTNGPIRSGDDVEVVKEDKPKDTTDWDAFRREAAKDVLCALVIHCSLSGKDCSKIAIEYADELIKQLKDEEK